MRYPVLWFLVAIALANGVLDYHQGVLCEVAPANTSVTLELRVNSAYPRELQLAIVRYSELQVDDFQYVTNYTDKYFLDQHEKGGVTGDITWEDYVFPFESKPEPLILINPVFSTQGSTLRHTLYHPGIDEGVWCVFTKPLTRDTSVSVNFYLQPGNLNYLEFLRYKFAMWAFFGGMYVLFQLTWSNRKPPVDSAVMTREELLYIARLYRDMRVYLVLPFVATMFVTLCWGTVKNDWVSREALVAGHESVGVVLFDWVATKMELLLHVWFETVIFLISLGYRYTYMATFPIDNDESRCRSMPSWTRFVARGSFIMTLVSILLCKIDINDPTGYASLGILGRPTYPVYLFWVVQTFAIAAIYLLRVMLLVLTVINLFGICLSLCYKSYRYCRGDRRNSRLGGAQNVAKVMVGMACWRNFVHMFMPALSIGWDEYAAHSLNSYGYAVFQIFVYTWWFRFISAHEMGQRWASMQGETSVTGVEVELVDMALRKSKEELV